MFLWQTALANPGLCQYQVTNDAMAKQKATGKQVAGRETPAGAPISDRPPPLFYRKPRPVNKITHGKLRIKQQAWFGFAGNANSVPINVSEFALAQRYYPIVFTKEAVPVPLAVLGLRDRENLFVDAKGMWSKGCYVPAYVRRYPFIFMAGPGPDKFTLCLDEEAAVFDEHKGTLLFDGDGKTAPLIDNALEVCSAFQAGSIDTREFGQALKTHELLVDQQANATIDGGEKLSLGGFMIVDEKRFNALPHKVFLNWKSKGWLRLIYAHLLSMANWPVLAELARKAREPA